MIDQTIKLFPADKNYILKEAQANLKDVLLKKAAFRIMEAYRSYYNSLGLIDDLIEKLDSYTFEINPVLEHMYLDMAGYYRFQNADNQLELLFDGMDHYRKFSAEWKEVFVKWIDDFCLNYNFMKTLLAITVFYPGKQGEDLLLSRVRLYLNKHFNLKIYKHKGIQAYNAA